MKETELNKLLSTAIAMAARAFEHSFDRDGRPYILHCLWVMNKVRHLGDKYMIVAVLHDLFEDTDYDIKDLREFGFTEEIVQAIDVLTHKNGDTYETYINKISESFLATQVKLRDLEHNSRITRLKDIERLKKYQKAFLQLKEIRGYE